MHNPRTIILFWIFVLWLLKSVPFFGRGQTRKWTLKSSRPKINSFWDFFLYFGSNSNPTIIVQNRVWSLIRIVDATFTFFMNFRKTKNPNLNDTFSRLDVAFFFNWLLRNILDLLARDPRTVQEGKLLSADSYCL